jgi:hypothetical protein
MVLSFLDLSYRDTGSIPDFGKNEQKNLQERSLTNFPLSKTPFGEEEAYAYACFRNASNCASVAIITSSSSRVGLVSSWKIVILPPTFNTFLMICMRVGN